MADDRDKMQTGEQDEDVYSEEGADELEKDDEISPSEEGFMMGEREASMASGEIGTEVGRVTHYFGNISVAVIEITGEELKVGDTIRIKGATSDFTQRVDSMEVDHKSVDVAKKGDAVGMKVAENSRANDVVYLVEPEK